MIIESEWMYETGKWDNKISEFINRIIAEPVIKKIEIKVYRDIINDRDIVNFVGGPTGFESYRLEDLKSHDLDNDERFCICGGTINSWANCTVACKDIYEAIKQYEKEG